MNRWIPPFAIIFLSFICSAALAADSPHKKLDRDCAACHETSDWRQVTFRHEKTAFPLRASHSKAKCLYCHDVRDFSLVSAACNSCHTDVHQNQFPYLCASCHNENSWQDIDYQTIHSRSFTVLIGAHMQLDCETCHREAAEGAFRIAESQCSSCHEERYQSTTNPNHAEMGFPQQCDQCHSMVQWIPATFVEHESRFPISTGAHAGVWESCSTCHIEPGNFKAFTCFNCHEHSQSRTNGKHDEVGGYVYDSDACYSCHHNGRGED